MTLPLEETKRQIYELLQESTQLDEAEIADIKPEFEAVASIAAEYADRALLRDPTAVDIYETLWLVAETLNATVAGRLQGKMAALWETIFAVGVSGLIRGACLALKIPVPEL